MFDHGQVGAGEAVIATSDHGGGERDIAMSDHGQVGGGGGGIATFDHSQAGERGTLLCLTMARQGEGALLHLTMARQGGGAGGRSYV